MARVQAERSDAIVALAETFRRYGYAGTSLTSITEQTGLGKGSLYHFFPGGKADMADAVLEQVGDWFEQQVYQPLRVDTPPEERLEAMFGAVQDYFTSRHLVCLFAVFAIGHEQERFAERVRTYFTNWVDALAAALPESLDDRRQLAVETIATIQGALILARALGDEELFPATLSRLRTSLAHRIG